MENEELEDEEIDLPPDSQSRLAVMFGGLIVLAVALVLIAVSLAWQSSNPVLKDLAASLLNVLGTTMLVAVSFAVLQEFLLKRAMRLDLFRIVRRTVRRTVGSITTDALPKFQEALDRTIEEAMPPKYINIKRTGIVDAYPILMVEKWRDKIAGLHDSNIRVLKMWIPEIYTLEPEILKAVKDRGCSVRFLLLHPNCSEAIAKRAAATSTNDPRHMRSEILNNLRVLYSIWERLPKDARERFQIALHSNFIAVSLHGFADEFVFGLYLRGRLATQGTQIKAAGEEHWLFRELSTHFELEWNSAEILDLTEYSEDIFADSPAHSSVGGQDAT